MFVMADDEAVGFYTFHSLENEVRAVFSRPIRNVHNVANVTTGSYVQDGSKYIRIVESVVSTRTPVSPDVIDGPPDAITGHICVRYVTTVMFPTRKKKTV